LFLCLLAFLLPAYLLWTQFATIDQSDNNSARATWNAILADDIPSGAILVTNDRDEMIPLWYMQYVEGVRPDLTGLFPLIQPGQEWADVGATAESALRSGRPVMLIKEMPGLDVKFRLLPAGKLTRVLGPTAEDAPRRPADAVFGDAIRLPGFDIAPMMLTPGASATVRLHWQPTRSLALDYTTFVHLINADGRVIGASNHRAGGVYYPTSLWKPGETLVDTHTFNLAGENLAGELGRPPYAVEVGLYVVDKDLQHLGQPQRVGMVSRLRPPDSVPADLAIRFDANFGGQIVLLGGEISPPAAQLRVKLYWQAARAAAADYTIFLHLLDKEGKIVAQYDGQPAGGELPTRAWPPGYILADAVALDLSPSLPRGAYRLIAGLYDARTGARLPVIGAQADSVLLSEIIIPNDQ
jgi:hypothetical protein